MPSSRKTLVAGSLSGVVQLLFISLLALVSIPLFIPKLGAAAYGHYSLLSLALANYLITRFIPSAIPQILLVTGNTLVLSVMAYRCLNLVEQRDIERYFGSGNGGSRLLGRIFVR